MERRNFLKTLGIGATLAITPSIIAKTLVDETTNSLDLADGYLYFSYSWKGETRVSMMKFMAHTGPIRSGVATHTFTDKLKDIKVVLKDVKVIDIIYIKDNFWVSHNQDKRWKPVAEYFSSEEWIERDELQRQWIKEPWNRVDIGKPQLIIQLENAIKIYTSQLQNGQPLLSKEENRIISKSILRASLKRITYTPELCVI